MSVLSVENVQYLYRRTIRALDGVSLDVEDGDFLAITGPNGSGKTTLMGVMSGVFEPSVGSVTLLGKPISSFSRREIGRIIGYVPQNIQVDFPFTCREIVLMGRYPHLGGLGIESEADRKRADEALCLTGTLEFANRMVHQLSGGEKQRVFIAQALAAEPKILMLDEPISALDIKYRLQIMNLLTRLNKEKGITIITVLHDLSLAATHARHVALMNHGKLQATGIPEITITPEIVREVFDVEVEILTLDDGMERVVIPRVKPEY